MITLGFYTDGCGFIIKHYNSQSIARKFVNLKLFTSQEEQKAVLSFTEELERRRLEEQIAKTTEQVESNKMLLERQQQIRRQVSLF